MAKRLVWVAVSLAWLALIAVGVRAYQSALSTAFPIPTTLRIEVDEGHFVYSSAARHLPNQTVPISPFNLYRSGDELFVLLAYVPHIFDALAGNVRLFPRDGLPVDGFFDRGEVPLSKQSFHDEMNDALANVRTNRLVMTNHNQETLIIESQQNHKTGRSQCLQGCEYRYFGLQMGGLIEAGPVLGVMSINALARFAGAEMLFDADTKVLTVRPKAVKK